VLKCCKCELYIGLRLHRYDTELAQMAGQSVEMMDGIGNMGIVDMDRKDFSNFERGYYGPE
jgi:hypothetical protein